MIKYKNGQRICTKINFNLEESDLDKEEQRQTAELVQSLGLNTVCENLQNASEADSKRSTEHTKATSIYLRDTLEDKGIKEIFSLIKKEWFSRKDVDLSLSRLRGPAFILAFVFWILR